MDEVREAELEELLKEPLIDILRRQMKEADDLKFANGFYLQHRPTYQQTEITLRFIDEDVRRMDRQRFRRHVSERLNAVGDALLAGWDYLHPEAGA